MKKRAIEIIAMMLSAAMLLAMAGCDRYAQAMEAEAEKGISYDKVVCRYVTGAQMSWDADFADRYTVYADNVLVVETYDGIIETEDGWEHTGTLCSREIELTQEQVDKLIATIRRSRAWELDNCSDYDIMDGAFAYIMLFDEKGEAVHRFGGSNPTMSRFCDIEGAIRDMLPKEEREALKEETKKLMAEIEECVRDWGCEYGLPHAYEMHYRISGGEPALIYSRIPADADDSDALETEYRFEWVPNESDSDNTDSEWKTVITVNIQQRSDDGEATVLATKQFDVTYEQWCEYFDFIYSCRLLEMPPNDHILPDDMTGEVREAFSWFAENGEECVRISRVGAEEESFRKAAHYVMTRVPQWQIDKLMEEAQSLLLENNK